MNWLYGGVIDNIKGFRVNVTSYLFRLKWDDETAGQFYTDFYTDSQDYDKKKVQAWQDSKGLFKMEFVGKISNKSSKTIMSGVKTNEELIRISQTFNTLLQNSASKPHLSVRDL